MALYFLKCIVMQYIAYMYALSAKIIIIKANKALAAAVVETSFSNQNM